MKVGPACISLLTLGIDGPPSDPGVMALPRAPERMGVTESSTTAVSRTPPSVSVRTELKRKLAEIPGLDVRSSRWGPRPAYYVGDREIAHFHGEERMDVRLTKELIRHRRAEHAFDARVHTRGPSAEWASVTV